MKQTIVLILVFVIGYWIGKLVIPSEESQPQVIIKRDTVLTTSTDTIYAPPTNITRKAHRTSGNVSGLQDSDNDSIIVHPMQKDSILSDYYELEYKGKQDSTEYTLTMGTQTIPYWYKLEFATHIPTTTVKVQETKQKKQHWSISPQIGIGYGLFHSKFDVYCGVGVAYEF